MLRQLDADPRAHAAELALGIRSHLHADAAFHRHADFQRRTDLVAGAVLQAIPEMRHVHIAAHVCVEMLLDRFLIDTDPTILDRYYSTFTPEHIATASETTLSEPGAAAALQALLRRFAESAFLREYRSTPGLLVRMMRSLSHGGFDQTSTEVLHKLEPVVDELYVLLREGSTWLIDEVRRAVESRRLG